MYPKISIIIAVRNNRDQLKALLESISFQDLPRDQFEVLVVDAMSTDGTVDVIREYGSIVTWWISEADAGVYDAWNKAIKKVSGEWISFIGSDDFYPSASTLSLVVGDLDKAKSLGRLYVYGVCNLYSWSLPGVVGRYNPNEADLMRTLPQGRFILHSGSYHHAHLFRDYGHFDISYKIAGDYAFLLRYLKSNRPYFVNKPLVNMGMSGLSSGASRRHSFALFKECLRAYRESLRGFPFRIYIRFLLKLTKL